MRLLIEIDCAEVEITPVQQRGGEILGYSIQSPGVDIFLDPLEAARLDLTLRQATGETPPSE